ncbi:hypothetical protein Tco_1478312 [Tanacetum coccineum]
MEFILKDKDAMDKGVADKLKNRKPNDADRDEGPPARPDQGLKRKKTKETVFEAGDTQGPQDQGDDMGNTDEPPIVSANSKDWFKKQKGPPTPYLEWNECKTIDNKPTHKCLSDLSKAEKTPKTFDDLMSTLIDFNAFVMNRLSYIELKYNMEECYKALTDQLD